VTNVWGLLAAAVGGGGLAGVATTLISGVLNRPKTRADAVALLTGSAIQQVNELQERTAEAEREAKAARTEAAQARQQMRELTGEIDAAVATLRTWRSAILEPVSLDAALRLEQLRAMVRDPGGTINGRHL
jgi:outer membrane murein-binding lipoprotein Lpp